jgi:cystathionine beta-lyase
MKKPKKPRGDTRFVSLGRKPHEHYGFVNTPIYRGSTVLFKNVDDFIHRRGPYEYGRLGTPGSDALHSAWAELSGAAGVVSVSSGLAAITLALLSCLKAGDHLLVTDSVYFPTRRLCDKVLKHYGIEVTYYEALVGSKIEKLFKANTKAVYTESPSSLTFEVQDIPAIAKIAHERGAAVLMDNTWATPLFFDAHKHGVDISIEAGTKYLIGHSDAMIGMVSANEKYWPSINDTFRNLGICAGPDDIFLSLRGLRTMPLRLRHQGKTALNIAGWLLEQAEVARVLHPALPSCPGHEIWKRDFSGSSSVFAIELQPAFANSAAAMVDGLELFSIGASWGGFESLIVPFDCSYRKISSKGVGLRLQIGLEEEDDLKADLKAGLARLRQS